MRTFLAIVYFFTHCVITKTDSEQQPRFYPHVGMPELARLYGYFAEEHAVTTDDGYILTLHRIYKNRNLSPPVMIVHGVIDCSTDFVNMGKDRALALILAEEGYDVWLPNLRGNRYSRKHKTIYPVDKHDWRFWDYSFHEIGIFDLPASIDYVLEQTGDEKVIYIGHSMGTTVFYIMASVLPQYNNKIQLMINLAPIAYLTYVRGLIKLVIGKVPEIAWFLNNTLHTYEIAPNMEWMKLVGLYCTERELVVTREICAFEFFLVVGFDPKGLDLSSLETIAHAYPAGGSVKIFQHYYQIYETGMFRMYDYGSVENYKHYGQNTPPFYNLSQINVPVSLVWSNNDFISTKQDVARLASELPNVIDNYKIKYSAFNHFDYPWGYPVNGETFIHVIELMKSFSRDTTPTM